MTRKLRGVRVLCVLCAGAEKLPAERKAPRRVSTTLLAAKEELCSSTEPTTSAAPPAADDKPLAASTPKRGRGRPRKGYEGIPKICEHTSVCYKRTVEMKRHYVCTWLALLQMCLSTDWKELDNLPPKQRTRRTHQLRLRWDPNYSKAKTQANLMDKVRHHTSRLKQSMEEVKQVCGKDITKLSAFQTLKQGASLSPQKSGAAAVAVVRPRAKPSNSAVTALNRPATAAAPVGSTSTSQATSVQGENRAGTEPCQPVEKLSNADTQVIACCTLSFMFK